MDLCYRNDANLLNSRRRFETVNLHSSMNEEETKHNFSLDCGSADSRCCSGQSLEMIKREYLLQSLLLLLLLLRLTFFKSG